MVKAIKQVLYILPLVCKNSHSKFVYREGSIKSSEIARIGAVRIYCKGKWNESKWDKLRNRRRKNEWNLE